MLRTPATEDLNGEWSRIITPGSYYSVYPDLNTLSQDSAAYYAGLLPLLGIKTNDSEQLKFLKRYARVNADKILVTPTNRAPFLRFHAAGNTFFTPDDAGTIRTMLQRFKPKRYIEVGCGFTTAALLDICEIDHHRPQITCIEPYPERLKQLLRPTDRAKLTLIEKPLQAVPLSVFETLQSGDVLFIDSTHVSKFGSDLHKVFFEILPRLQTGVVIHFHDIFYPFDYPRSWYVNDKRAWNEPHMLRAILANSNQYKILFWMNYLHFAHPEAMKRLCPDAVADYNSSFWMQKTGRRAPPAPAIATGRHFLAE